MKKLFSIILAASLVAFSLTGCNKSSSQPPAVADEASTFNIVTTIFPPYDFAREIAGDKADISMLLPPGAESHSFEPTPQDIIAIQNCDLFIYVGGESDVWVDDILHSMGDKAPRTLTLLDCVDAVEEETVEGMQQESHDHEHEDEHEHEHEEEVEYDEHVWTSPKNAIKIVKRMTEVLSEIDSENATVYADNSSAYIEKLNALDEKLNGIASTAARKTIVMGDRFPFRYLADAYGIDYYAAFVGCSSETEVSASTVAFLIDKVKAEGIPAVLYIEFSNHKIADAIAETANVKTLLLHSCHNVSKDELQAGATYLSLMKQNALTLKEVLN